MKIYILFILSIFSMNSFGQDHDYLTKLKEGVQTEAEVIELTKPIIELSKKPLRFFKVKDFTNEQYFIVQYIPENITDDEWSNDSERKYEDEAVVFQFYYSNKGEDKNLEISGVKTFYFSDVRGKYLCLFPYWKTYFDENADLEIVSKKRYVKTSGFNFSGSSGKWRIR